MVLAVAVLTSSAGFCLTAGAFPRQGIFVRPAVETRVLYAGSPSAVAARPRAAAVSAILVDAQSGQVLWAKNPDEKRAIASTTKIMTAIVTLDKAELDATVTVSKKASAVGEASLLLEAGEKRKVRELLYGIMLRSGNDAAEALAEYVGRGSAPRFLKMMNEKARMLGARRTHFNNPHGLPDPKHYSTARDLAAIASYGLKNPVFAKIVRTKRYEMPWAKHRYRREIENHNKLLWRYGFAQGIKTGYTVAAGYCLVAYGKRSGAGVISVVLGESSSDSAYRDSQRLLEYGFRVFRPLRVARAGVKLKTLDFDSLGLERVGARVSRSLTLKVPRSAKVTRKLIVSRGLALPVRKGQRVGKLRFFVGGRAIQEVDLVADRTVDQPTFLLRTYIGLRSLWNGAPRR